MGRGAGRKIAQKAILHGKRHDNKILKVKMLLSSNFVVMAQAPKIKGALHFSHLLRWWGRTPKTVGSSSKCSVSGRKIFAMEMPKHFAALRSVDWQGSLGTIKTHRRFLAFS